MAIKFCTDCGKKIEYKFSPPKFCSECGSSIGIASVNESTPPKRTSRKIISINENETDAESVPYIEKLEYEIETFGGDVQQTLGSLGGHSLPTKRKTNIKHFDDL